MHPSSGQQFELRRGSQRAVVVEVGGGLREYIADDLPVLDGFDIDQMADGGRGQPLLPWPNRLADGAYDFDGQHFQLAIDDISGRNAIHGLTRWVNWTATEVATDHVHIDLVLHPRPGYPFTLELGIVYTLDDGGLSVRTTARNLGARPLPFGAGQHPYFSVGSPYIDSAELHLPAGEQLVLDNRQLPTGERVANTLFRRRELIGARVFDGCFTSLDRDSDGRARIELRNPSTGRTVVVWMDASYRYAQLYSGETLAPERRRQGLAIEPMTCPPNAFRTAIDLIVLEPGQEHTSEWGVFVTSV